MTGIIISGFGLSAFIFSTVAHALFPGDTSGFLLALAFGTATPTVLGWFFIRPCPYPEHTAGTTPEGNGGEEPDVTGSDETTRLIRKNDNDKPLCDSGLALMRTIDFWILFWFMSLCEPSRLKDFPRGR